MKNKIYFLLAIVAWFFVNIGSPFAAKPERGEIPPNLEQWKGWVLHNVEDKLCPTYYNNGERCQCLWPSRLTLNLENNKGGFNQEWRVFIKAWVPLPGNPETWPAEVKVDGKPAPVVGKNNIPAVYLTPGVHRTEGVFTWKEMPEWLNVPPESGLVSLSINGNPIQFPFIENSGRLWLKKKEGGLGKEDSVECRVFRLIKDAIPLEVNNLLKINVSGQPREITLPGVLLEGAVPLNIQSPLPARLSPEGDIILQVRPGQWEIQIISRFEGPISKLTPLKKTLQDEVWSFQAQNQLRMVKIEGVSPIDPKQTDVPSQWQNFPTFIMHPGLEMIFKEIRRGDPDPAPDQLFLYRTWWLDFDGRGFTTKDQVTGTLSRQWYLAINPPSQLGRVTIEGVEQLITGHGKGKKPGIELRKGHLQLESEGRLETSLWKIPAVGWDHDFESVSGVLNLPPGWKLLIASGIDGIEGTWVKQWSLLDLFLVLIISLVIYKLWNWKWGILALFAVGLTYHEPGAPHLVWLNLLAALALLRFLPEGWAKKVVNLWRIGSIIFLLIFSIPFVVKQVRWGIYPQLEDIYPPMGITVGPSKMMPQTVMEELSSKEEMQAGSEQLVPVPQVQAPREKKDSFFIGKPKLKGEFQQQYQNLTALTQDPHALNQTGPGLPTWKWRAIPLTWTGPVSKEQEIRLFLLSPFTNLILSFLRVGFLVSLIFFLLSVRTWKLPGNKIVSLVLFIVLALGATSTRAEQDAGYPSPELLQKLQERLLEKPECLPNCADSPKMLLTANKNSLRILFNVDAGVETAVPLPGSLKSWMPEEVLLNGQPARGLMKDHAGVLWVLIPEGFHVVTLYGRVPAERSFSVVLPLRPRKVTFETDGWTVQGVQPDGQVESSLQLTREEKNLPESQAKPEAAIPPFFQLERVLTLGLNWKVKNTLRRVTPPDTPATLFIPLIARESVTSPGIQVEKSRVRITIAANETEVTWSSTLQESPTIILLAPKEVPWIETWILDASPIWHCELSGIPVIHHQDQANYWMPLWQPWPGEKVIITLSRPQAIPGSTLTIEEAKLDLTPGERYTNGELLFKVRTSKGGEHRVIVPADAKIMAVIINNKTQPIKREGKEVIIPLAPGLQRVEVKWQQPTSSPPIIRSPLVSVGPQAVNADMVFKMPQNRWILFAGGPRLGPAVLFWSYVVVVILAAVALGRLTLTPLKTTHWFLLGLGITQVTPMMAIIILGWLLALGLRRLKPIPENQRFSFNVSQLLLVVLTVAALICLYLAVEAGLLGIPDMQIAGNGSSNFYLHWTQDRIGALMPQPWVLSLPLFVFRILMLLWALWLAGSLLKWLRWGWQCFSEGGIWMKRTTGQKEK
ncbi:MAG: hypothetical protein OS130_13575 [Thermodesulfobacteriota bacterium]|nr:MAG: hypothetical protein OS130_13575 [Thermodesulfobacteriota bacterium]